MRPDITGTTVVAGVVGAPVAHSLSPILHNAWIAAAGLNAVYVAFPVPLGRFRTFAEGLRGGAVRGVNVTAPFKEEALALADMATDRAIASGAANLLIFEPSGEIHADNTDGVGLLASFAEQAPHFTPTTGPVVILGAGGAARGAAVALLDHGVPEVRIVNRSVERALALADMLGRRTVAFGWDQAALAMSDAVAIINATPVGRLDVDSVEAPIDAAPPEAVVMDMTYRPLRTPMLRRAAASGMTTVDGLAMLIGQAAPSYERFFSIAPPRIDVRALALRSLEQDR